MHPHLVPRRTEKNRMFLLHGCEHFRGCPTNSGPRKPPNSDPSRVAGNIVPSVVARWQAHRRASIRAAAAQSSILILGDGQNCKRVSVTIQLFRQTANSFTSFAGTLDGVYRVGVSGGRVERVVDLKGFHHIGAVGLWMGLDPTDTPMLIRDRESADIYALTLEEK